VLQRQFQRNSLAPLYGLPLSRKNSFDPGQARCSTSHSFLGVMRGGFTHFGTKEK
jgi:hypothetical protein